MFAGKLVSSEQVTNLQSCIIIKRLPQQYHPCSKKKHTLILLIKEYKTFSILKRYKGRMNCLYDSKRFNEQAVFTKKPNFIGIRS